MRGHWSVWVAIALAPLLCGGAAASRRDAPPPSPRFDPPAEGVLFSENFSSGLGRWTADRAGVWTIEDGVLRARLPDVKQQRSLLSAGDSTWRDYALDFDACMMRGVDKGAVVRVQGDVGIGIDVRGGTYQDVVAYVREWPVGRGTAITADGTWCHVRIEAVRDRLRVWVNGSLRIDRTVTRARQGRIALAAYTGGAGECTVYYDNVVVTSR